MRKRAEEQDVGGEVSTQEFASRRRKKVVGDPAATKEKVEELSGELKTAMAQEQAKEDEIKHPLAWGSANRAGMVPVAKEFQAIVETIIVDDPKGTYEKLERELVVGDKRTDYGSMMRHLDHAERNARDAHRLWQTAIIEKKRWEMENEVVLAAARSEATRSLQAEKEKGLRSKQITDADVESRVAAIFPDEWKAQQHERARMSAMVASLENLSEVWLSRCRTLQALVAKQR
jgi:hypothetical protein